MAASVVWSWCPAIGPTWPRASGRCWASTARSAIAAQIPAAEADVARRFVAEHQVLRPGLDRIRAAADALGQPDADALAEAHRVHRFLVEQLAPHEAAELYPILDRVLGGAETTVTMSRAHAEIARLIRRLGHVLDDLDCAQPDEAEVLELRRLLYGLHASLRLHFAQQEEGYFSLLDEPNEPSVARRSTGGTPVVAGG